MDEALGMGRSLKEQAGVSHGTEDHMECGPCPCTARYRRYTSFALLSELAQTQKTLLLLPCDSDSKS